MAAAGFEDSTAEMSVVILGPAKGQEEEAEAEPQIYPLVTDDDVSEKQLRRCVESQPSWRQSGCRSPRLLLNRMRACRFVTDYLEGKIDPSSGGATSRGRRKSGGKAGKTEGIAHQMPASGVPSPAPPVSGVPSPAPRVADEL